MPKDTNIRQRRLHGSKAAGGTRLDRASTSDPWKVVPTATGSLNLSGTQITRSEGHRWPPPRRFSGDLGGPFSTVKCETVCSPSNISIEDSFKLKKYIGSVTCPHPRISSLTGPTYPASSLSPAGDLNALGATAIALSSPTNSVAESATFLAEMHREGLPSLPGIRLWKGRTKALLGIAEEFLNAEFGWLPLVSDITNTANAVRHARTVLSQYKRDEGKLVRRQFRFPIEHTESDTIYKENIKAILGNGSFNVPGFNSGLSGTVRCHRNVTRKTWFSGAFTYHIPSQNDSWLGLMSAGSEADKLFGTSLTPEVLWELTPWSWAIDWFSNAQEVIHNLQSIEIYGLVLQYGYMMDETIISDTYTMDGDSGYKGVKVSSVAPVTLTTVSKQRVKANPFGFGVEWADLSPTQLAIAAALGITHVL